MLKKLRVLIDLQQPIPMKTMQVYLDTQSAAPQPHRNSIHRETILASIDFLQRVMRIMIRKFGNKRKVCLLVERLSKASFAQNLLLHRGKIFQFASSEE